jgi:glycosyltransferase involved in cell wall biosynthesis
MRILYLNPSGKPGGAERALLDLIAALREARPGWDLHLVAGSEGAFPAAARGLGVHTSIVPFPRVVARMGDSGDAAASQWMLRAPKLCAASIAGAAYAGRLRSAIREIAPDLVHTNGFKMHMMGAMVRPAGVPLIWHVRDYLSGRPLMARVMPMMRGRCDAAIANSASVAADLLAHCPGLAVEAAHDAIDLNEFSPDGPILDLDALAGLTAAPEGTVRVGLVSTMARWKGQQVFLEAIARVDSRCPLRGYIIGGPIYETEGSQFSIEYLRSVARRLGLGDRVGFTGFVERPSAAIRALDIVVHASTAPEPFGLAIAEAMACGKALITSARGGAVELIADGADSMVFPPGDAAALAERIERIAADRELRRRLGANARAGAETRFTRERLVAQVLDVYERVTQGAAAA